MKVTEVDRYFLTDTGSQWRHFLGAFGWLDPGGEGYQTKHCLLVGGQLWDGRYVVAEEYLGTLNEILEAAVDAKDRLYIKGIWGDHTDKAIMQQVWAHEGLTTYNPLSVKPDTGLVTYAEPLPAKRWPNFRNHKTLCSVCSVPVAERASTEAGLARVDRFNVAGRFHWTPSCQTVANIMGERDISRLLNDPVAKAMTYLVWALEIHDEDLARPAMTNDHGGDLYGGRI